MYSKKCTTKKIYVQQYAYDNTEERRGKWYLKDLNIYDRIEGRK